MDSVRLGIVGIGNMGTTHARSLLANNIPRCRLTAICDHNADKLTQFPGLKHFTSANDMIHSGEIDAILIATPHYDHTTIGIEALRKGMHVMVEKPISVHKADCERLIAAYDTAGSKPVFGAMFNQRTDNYYIKIRDLIAKGELGEIRRVNWIITTWFRSEAYYASGGWRATWAGEGGGVLLNQCPHNLDLFQWIFGMPSKVRAFCRIAQYHNIEVEDDVTAYVEFPNGATGVFITSTGEAPGTNRLEITGDRGKLVYENDTLTFTRNEVPTAEFNRTTPHSFSVPETWQIKIPVQGHGDQHNGILKNFVDAILDGKPLIAPAQEGIHSVELANAMLYSSATGATVDMPLDAAAYEAHLKKLIASSKFQKKVSAPAANVDMSKSFN